MIHRILIPQIFENMEEATIGVWLKAEGDIVGVGEALCELITEKTTFQLESDSAGILRKIIAPEKAVVPVGALVAYVGNAEDEIPSEEAVSQIQDDTAPTLEVLLPSLVVPSVNDAPAGASGGRVRATPAARRVAKERGVAIEDVAAKFPGKVIGEDDVRNF
jgi:pyruvate dehydrogenase E2 component (dihydrolipoamide acetyltransferase)